MSAHEYDRGATYPRRSGHGWQYACVESRSGSAIGVTAMLEPIPPMGRGWQLVSGCIAGNTAFFWWRRRSSRKVTK